MNIYLITCNYCDFGFGFDLDFGIGLLSKYSSDVFIFGFKISKNKAIISRRTNVHI